MKKILFTVMLVVAVATAVAQDAARPAEEQPRNLRMADGTPPDKMDFDQWEFILSKGSQADRVRVWNVIKGTAVQMRGIVIKATGTECDFAASRDDIEARKVDVTLTFEHPVGMLPKVGESIPVNFIPKEGASIGFQGVVSSYTRNPFVLIMKKGALLRGVEPSTAAHKPASQ